MLGCRECAGPRGFTCALGTTQGDVSSPAAWVAVFRNPILLRNLEITSSNPFGIQGQRDISYPTPDLAYADDLGEEWWRGNSVDGPY